MTHHIKKLLVVAQSTLCLLLAVILSLPALAISENQLEFFNANGIYYYNPDGGSTSSNYCYTGDISISGSTAAQKVWSGLLGFLTPEQAAGALGNMTYEGGLNPVRHEISAKNNYWPDFDIINDSSQAYGIGLIQWSWGRRIGVLKFIQSSDSNLIQYFMNPDEYSTYGSGDKSSGDVFLEKVGDAVFDRLIQLEIEYLKNEIQTTPSYKGLLNTTSVDEAAKFFLDYIEVPTPANEYIHKGNEAYKEAYFETLATRQSGAQKYYREFNNTFLSPSGSNGTNITGSDITIIGDSITKSSASAIRAKLPNVDINAEDSRQFSTGITEAEKMNLRGTVVFALGTNSQGLTETQAQNAIDVIGQDRNIFFVTNYSLPERTNLDFTNNNDIFKKVAQNNANVKIIDWNKAVSQSSDPSQYVHNNDNLAVHPTDEGKDLFADLIYNAVTGNNLTNNGCSVSGSFQKTVADYAWPEYHEAPFTDRMPAYAEAVTRRASISTAYIGGTVNGVAGIDCGGFVTTLLQDSGFEPKYNTNDSEGTPVSNKNRNVPWQEYWTQTHGWTLLNSDVNTPVDPGILQPGDVAFSGDILTVNHGYPAGPGHTWVYVGQIADFDSTVASASYSEDGSVARAPMAGFESADYSNGQAVRWYRKGQ